MPDYHPTRDWSAIATAPHDGRRVELYYPKIGLRDGFWSEAGPRPHWITTEPVKRGAVPTHWRERA